MKEVLLSMFWGAMIWLAVSIVVGLLVGLVWPDDTAEGLK